MQCPSTSSVNHFIDCNFERSSLIASNQANISCFGPLVLGLRPAVKEVWCRAKFFGPQPHSLCWKLGIRSILIPWCLLDTHRNVHSSASVYTTCLNVHAHFFYLYYLSLFNSHLVNL